MVGTTVGKDWVGVGSRVMVGVPASGVGAAGLAGDAGGVKASVPGTEGMEVGVMLVGVGVSKLSTGAEARATIPRQ